MGHLLDGSRLDIVLQPEAQLSMHFKVLDPSSGNSTAAHTTWNYSEVMEKEPDAYQALIHNVIEGDASSFVRADEVMTSWRWTDLLRQTMLQTPLLIYPQNSQGPDTSSLFRP